MDNQIIEKLLNGAAVEWKPLDKIFYIKNGYTPSKSNKEFWENGTIPWFRMEDIRENGQILSNSLQKITENALKGGKLFPKNSIIVATSATIGEHALITVPFLANQRFTVLSLKEEFQSKFEIKFLFYYCFLLSEWCKNNTTMSSFASVDMVGFKKFEIPIPPLPIQEKIVKTLDKFTELEATLEATLEAELALRKKQYQYYRETLLTFPQDLDRGGYNAITKALHRSRSVVLKALGEVGEVRMCKRILKNQTTTTGDIPFYKIGTFGKEPNAYISREIFEEYKEKYSYPKKGDILISAAGTIGRTVIFDGQDAYFQDSNIVWIENDESQVLNKFLFYIYQQANWNVAEGGTIQRLYNDDLRKLKIPIPTIPEQQRIVEILDKFDRLTHSISEGLPKEIALRRKQYEYYRERLLDFPKC